MKIKQTLLLFSLIIVAPAQAYAGAIIIDGSDANEHGYVSSDANRGGWLYMQKALEALAARVPPGRPRLVVDLTTRPGPARSAIEFAFNLSSLRRRDNWEIKHLNSSQEIEFWLDKKLGDTGILYIPTFRLLGSDLTPEDMETINRHDKDIARFCNGVDGQGGGGALFAMGETGEKAWGWLPALLPGITVKDFGEEGIENPIKLTEAGMNVLPDLPEAEIEVARPWHNSFEGDFSRLQVLGTSRVSASDQLDRNVIIADKVTLADLMITNTALPDPAQAGSTIVYQVSVTNNGPDTATMAEAIINLDPSVTVISCDPPGACSGAGGAQIAMLGSLKPNATRTLTIQARVNCSAANDSILASSAVVKSTTPDEITSNNHAVGMTRIIAPTTTSLDKTKLDFGEVSARVESKKKTTPLSFTFTNTGLCSQQVTFQLLRRTGDGVKILNPNSGDCSKNESLRNPGDCKFFVFTDPSDPAGLEKGIVVGSYTAMVPVGEKRFDVTFRPVIPAFTNQTTGVPSDLILPEEFESALLISINGTAAQSLKLTSRIQPRVHLINPVDPGLAPVVTLARSGQVYAIEITVYDSAPEDVKKVRYDFRKGVNIIKTIEVDVQGAISENRELIRGQSFKIRQRFSVPDKKKVTDVLVTVIGGSSSDGPVPTSSGTSVSQAAGEPGTTAVEMKPIDLKFTQHKRRTHRRNP